MSPNETLARARATRREFLGVGAALAGVAAAGPLLAQQAGAPATAPALKGPPVWLDLDQAALDGRSKREGRIQRVAARAQQDLQFLAHPLQRSAGGR